MFWIALVCLVIALIAYWLGSDRVGEVAIQGAKLFAVIGLILILVSLLFGAGPFWGPPRAWW